MAGGVQDGQPVNAAVTDAAFLFKNAPDTTLSTLGGDDQDTSGISGLAIVNFQRELNALWSWLGGTINQVKTYLPTWPTSYYGLSTDTILARLKAIDLAYNPSGGELARRAGVVSIGAGDTVIPVAFSAAWPDTLYAVNFTFETTDANPIFIQGMVTTKLTTGFTVTLAAPPDTANYKMSYVIRKAG
jgi:hypothetical protein